MPDSTPEFESPQVLPDGRVVFRLDAPEASEVTIAGDWVSHGMEIDGKLEKDPQGTWSLTVGPLRADFYTYRLRVDGVPTIDPRNPNIKHSSERLENIFYVPGEAVRFADALPVPHGEVRIAWYDSPVASSARRMHVYTPPGYDSSTRAYPVLYLLHGGGEEDAAWSTIGRAGFILDNLLASGKAEPMIVVMPHGRIELPGLSLRGSSIDWTSPQAVRERMQTIMRQHDLFIEDLLNTILPLVESRYRVLPGHEQRAIAGLSMGGAQTLRAGPPHLELFAWFGVFSVGLAGMQFDLEERNAQFFADPARSNAQIRLLYFAAGDNDSIIGEGARQLAEAYGQHGIQHEFHQSEGGHIWINWRRYFYDFAQRLFREPEQEG